MLASYVYPTDIGKSIPSWEDYKYGVEYLFASLLAKSKFRTMVRLCIARTVLGMWLILGSK
jgi:hypothetical protein